MLERLLIRLFPLLLLAPSAPLRAQAAPPNLGRVWQVHDWNDPQWDFSGTWIRRGDTNQFLLEYRPKHGGDTMKGTVLVTVQGREVTARLLEGSGKLYHGTIQNDGRTIVGKGSWCKPFSDCGFQAVADWQASAQVLPDPERIVGTVWKVHDYTIAGYDYSGTWTRDPKGRIFRFEYRNKADGKPAAGILRFRAFNGEEFIVGNSFLQGNYRGKLQPDGKTIKGTADWCKPKTTCGWEATIEK